MVERRVPAPVVLVGTNLAMVALAQTPVQAAPPAPAWAARALVVVALRWVAAAKVGAPAAGQAPLRRVAHPLLAGVHRPQVVRPPLKAAHPRVVAAAATLLEHRLRQAPACWSATAVRRARVIGFSRCSPRLLQRRWRSKQA